MNILQRITATFTHTVSNVVSHVENHDAVVEAAIRETQAAAAKARVRLTRLRKDGEHMRRKHAELTEMGAVWEQRALTTAKDDAQKALECVKRRNLCRRQKTQAAESLARHEEVERGVGASVERIEQRLTELSQQRNTLRSRNSAADAQRVINRIENSSAHGIEDIFDRWEMLVTETEYDNGNTAPVDTFDAAFEKQENDEALKADLRALLEANAAQPHTDKE